MSDTIDLEPSPYADIDLPINITLPDGRAAKIAALRQTEQLPEATTDDTATGWIDVTEGYLLTECVYDINAGQSACVVRLALDLSGDVKDQVENALQS
jgi:hypothetical protein